MVSARRGRAARPFSPRPDTAAPPHHPDAFIAPVAVHGPMPGLWFEEFETGRTISHEGRLKLTMEDNVAFCRLTRNTQPLHLDEDYARTTRFGQIVVNGLYTFAASVGMSVGDLTEGTLVANLAYEDVVHPAPVFPGDTIRVTSEVLEARPSSKPGRGVVTLRHRVFNQDHVEVCRYRRIALVQRRPEAA